MGLHDAVIYGFPYELRPKTENRISGTFTEKGMLEIGMAIDLLRGLLQIFLWNIFATGNQVMGICSIYYLVTHQLLSQKWPDTYLNRQDSGLLILVSGRFHQCQCVCQTMNTKVAKLCMGRGYNLPSFFSINSTHTDPSIW